MRILIDHNVKPAIRTVLADLGWEAESAKFNKLDKMTNGMLTREAYRLGFRCILTQDRSFENEAAHVLKDLPMMAIIVIDTKVLSQNPRSTYLRRFRDMAAKSKLRPVAGKVTLWPPSE